MKVTPAWLIWRPEWGLMLGWIRGPIPTDVSVLPPGFTSDRTSFGCRVGLHLVWEYGPETYALWACSILPVWGLRRLLWVRALRVGPHGTWQPVSLGHDMEAG